MLYLLPTPIRGLISSLLLGLNTAVHALPILAIALLKLLIPLRSWRALCSRLLNGLVSSWIDCNGLWIKLTRKDCWETDIEGELRRDQWYLVTCNHQSWADIFIVQRLLNHRAPQLKFFLKQELIWVPVIGLCWWALDFPFMKRYSRNYLRKHPEKRGKDFETTRRACAKFRHLPVAIFNFMEGTRFSATKQKNQNSPYRHLLRPRPGGTGFVLGAMGNELHQFLDITIAYPDGVPGFWDFLCGEKARVRIRIVTRAIPSHLRGHDYGSEPDFRAEVQQWVNELWATKDELLDQLS